MSEIAVVHAGIDVSAKELTVAASRDGRLVGRRSFGNTAGGRRQLVQWLTAKAGRVHVCLEATGIYHLNTAMTLSREGIGVMVLNPRVSSDYAKARMQRSKTDAADAEVLLDYVQRMPFVHWTQPAPERLALRAMLRRISALKRMLVEEKNRLAAARAADHEFPAVIRNDIEVSLRHLERRITQMRRQALELVEEHAHLRRCYELLVTVTGIGQVTALQLTAELLMLPADMTARQLVAHAGLDPRRHESGTSVHKPPRISKAGNRHLRAALFLPAFAAIRYDQYVRAFYDRLLSRGKKPLQATLAVMRKLLHAVHGMLVSDTPFDSSRFTSLAA